MNYKNMKNEISQLQDFVEKVDKVNNEVLASIYNSDKMVEAIRELGSKKAEIVSTCKEFANEYKILENHEDLICIKNKMESELEGSKLISENEKDFIKSGIQTYREFLGLLLNYARSKDNSIIYPLVNKARQTVDIYEVIIDKVNKIA
ncbi:hypothetical protein [Clostridium senegalense]